MRLDRQCQATCRVLKRAVRDLRRKLQIPIRVPRFDREEVITEPTEPVEEVVDEVEEPVEETPVDE